MHIDDQNLNSTTMPPENTAEKKPELKSIGQYARELRSELPKDLLKPNTARLGYFVLFYTLIAVSLYSLLSFELAWYAKTSLALVIGYAFGGAAFFAHETLHGSVVRNTKFQNILGFIGFMPFLISPTFWRFWHNRLHHGHTQKIIQDPDAFPTLRIYKQSKYVQNTFKFTPGSGHLVSYAYFFFWFTFHNVVNQVHLRFRNKIFKDLNHNLVSLEFVAQVTSVATYIYLMGASNVLYTYIIPFMVMNYMLMSYISTNHNISPLTKSNDPLANSLTVTNNPLFEKMHLNFGYHVEHHLFPTMSPANAKKVNVVVKKKYEATFQQMTKLEAMKRLYATPRIYKNMNTLVHPHTGETHKTL